MQFSFDNLKRAVWTNNASREAQRKSGFCFLSFVLQIMKAGYLLQYIVYGDGSLYSYRIICWNI